MTGCNFCDVCYILIGASQRPCSYIAIMILLFSAALAEPLTCVELQTAVIDSVPVPEMLAAIRDEGVWRAEEACVAAAETLPLAVQSAAIANLVDGPRLPPAPKVNSKAEPYLIGDDPKVVDEQDLSDVEPLDSESRPGSGGRGMVAAGMVCGVAGILTAFVAGLEGSAAADADSADAAIDHVNAAQTWSIVSLLALGTAPILVGGGVLIMLPE